MVVLEDIKSKMESNSSSGSTESLVPGILTPRATPSPMLTEETESSPRKKRRKSWDPKAMYEVEKIIGYHIDEMRQITYYVKWKGWSSRFNSYEPVENLVNCNYLLMKHFETGRLSTNHIKKMEEEIEKSLETYRVYDELKKSNYNKQELKKFSRSCLNISDLFSPRLFENFEAESKKQFGFVVRCLVSMYDHRDDGMFRRGQNYNICLKLCELRRKQLEDLKVWEKKINSVEKCFVGLQNDRDLDLLPAELDYSTEMKSFPGVIVPDDPLVGCDCEEACSIRSSCCGIMSNSTFAYNAHRKLRIPEQTAIYECNSRCSCPPECTNRVVQHGRNIKLCVFKTESCGWGVKTLEKIQKGSFICEYIGELIPDKEAVVRDIEYCRQNISYLFDLDFNEEDEEENMHCVDATNTGNLARFINHSCEPNLVVYPVWIDCLDPNLPRLAFFAKRNIQKDEEIHFDYENIGDIEEETDQDEDRKNLRLRMISRVRCQCRSKSCREWVFGNK